MYQQTTGKPPEIYSILMVYIVNVFL